MVTVIYKISLYNINSIMKKISSIPDKNFKFPAVKSHKLEQRDKSGWNKFGGFEKLGIIAFTS